MRHLTFIVGSLLIFGTLYRLWPIVTGMPALATFFITEDGYLMLTVARNLAIGNGLSVSDGTIATNGVQPLATFLFSVPYLATGGDKIASLVWIHLIHAATALATVFAIRALATRALKPYSDNSVWPWAAALMWFLAPLILRHSMNGLETSLYTLVLVLTLLVFARTLDARDSATPGARLFLGFMCGLSVLARNDAVFLVTSIFAVWAIWELFVTRSGFAAMVTRLVTPGVLSIAVAAPWLIFNKINFGSIVPVSGTAQSLGAPIGGNLPLLPSKLFEYALPMLPIPSGIETLPAVIGICIAAVALILLIFTWAASRAGSGAIRAVLLAYGMTVAALAVYYGTFFGAAHFLSRYLAPTAPFLIIATLVAALQLGRWITRTRPTLFAWLYTGGGITLSFLLLMRALMPGATLQGHEQVIAWMSENVPEETWIGAVQTGTLGYWHDRTYNLDGKVNPEALAEREAKGHVLDYVTDSDIDYIIDWAGVADWPGFPEATNGFAAAFEAVVKDEDANLGVLRRKGVE